MLLNDAQFKTCSADFLILTYDNVPTCNLAMKKENKSLISKHMSEFFNTKLDFITIPESTWNEMSNEFIKKYRENMAKGVREDIELNKAYVKGLRIESEAQKEVEEKKDDKYQDLMDTFKDFMEIK